MDERKPSPHDPIARWKWVHSWSPHLPGAAYKVLHDLAIRSGKTGTCWPSHATIASATGLTVPGVRTALAALRTVGVVTSVGKGGRNEHGNALSSTYHLHVNVMPPHHVEEGSTCCAHSANVMSPHHQRDVPTSLTCCPSINKGGLEGGIDGGFHPGEPGRTLNPSGEKTPKAPQAATREIIDTIVRNARRLRPGLEYVANEIIAMTVERFPAKALAYAWDDCDRLKPDKKDGEDTTSQYLWRFKGRSNGSGGWDRYKPLKKRTEPLTQDEAVQMAKELNDAWLAKVVP